MDHFLIYAVIKFQRAKFNFILADKSFSLQKSKLVFFSTKKIGMY